MTLSLLMSFLVLFAVDAARGNPAVMEIKTSYSCCDRTIPFNPDCENTWIINNMIFAYTSGAANRFIAPCWKIEGGLMTLDRCADVNVTAVCKDEMNVAVEKRFRFSGQLCPGSASNTAGSQGSLAVFLLMMVIAGLTVTC